jgi:hypothetical protein
MAPRYLDWRFWAMIASLVLTVGWLDIVRGRQLAIVAARQEMVLHELDRLRDDMERLKARRP